jgi:stage II sporulation protein AA (anti-sigma F factor antagonist)
MKKRMEKFQMKQKTLIIRMPKELDHYSAQEIRTRADQIIREENVNMVEFDFRDTDFMDSSGIGVIMGRYQNIHLLGGCVAATHVNDRIYKILKLAGLTKLIGVGREKLWTQGE